MPREYRHIAEYGEEILELKRKGKTNREIGQQLGFSTKQIGNFFTRHKEKQAKLAAGMALRKKGRPGRDYVVTEEMKIAELKYIFYHKAFLYCSHNLGQFKPSVCGSPIFFVYF